MSENTVIDPETLTYEQLEAAMHAEAAKPEPARDDQGRFVIQPEPEQKAEIVEDQPDEIVYRKEIDLGDGSGKQVFEAASLEDLIEKLADAQTHASKKIRELTQEKRVEKVAAAAPTDDQEWLVSQELLAKPSQTIRKQFEELVGMPIDAFKSKMARVEAFETAQREESVAQQFVAAHPEFVTNTRNATRFNKALEVQGLDKTLENLEKVYADLSESGLLELKSENDAETVDTATQTSRIASSGAKVITVTRKAASGISSKRSAAPVTPKEPTEEELYAMPYDKLEEYYRSKERNSK